VTTTSASTIPRSASPKGVVIEGVSIEAARAHVDAANKARTAYVRRLYRTDPGKTSPCHLVIDSTAIPLRSVVELILTASGAHTMTWQMRTPGRSGGQAPARACLVGRFGGRSLTPDRIGGDERLGDKGADVISRERKPVAQRTVSTTGELLSAIEDRVDEIRILGTLSGMASLRLPPGARLAGGTLMFGARGVVLSSDNSLDNVEIVCPSHEVAVANDTSQSSLGTLSLTNVRTKGQVLLSAENSVRDGSILIDGLEIEEADLRGRLERPHGYGVDAMQGALTIWNRHARPDVMVHAEVRAVSAGRPESPIRCSGVFVGGKGDREGRAVGGRVLVPLLQTDTIVVDGGITPGTPDLISGGVFVQTGARVESVVNSGPVTTLGANDMALDNWGEVTRWTATGPVTTWGVSAIGFVNFGTLLDLDVQAPIQTYGVGARGFNLYDGTLTSATFQSISTQADGAIAIQVAKPLSQLTIRSDVTTTGGEGASLVRGEQVQLRAIALSVKPEGRIERLTVGGNIRTVGDGVVSLELLGTVGRLEVGGGVVAEGSQSDAAHVRSTGAAVLDGVELTARKGRRLVTIDP
jgi:hypothetical protein